jgi:hypothetical protein
MTEKEEKENEVIESKEDSGLEEEIELAETNIDQDKFQDVMVNINSKSPSLEQVAIAPEPLTSLEMGVSEAPVTSKEKDDLYTEIYKREEDKSYKELQEHKSEDFAVTSSGAIARQNLGEIIQTDSKQEFQINPELQGMKKMQDDYADFKMSGEDLTKIKTQDPFQKSTKEYEFR